jgi:hypothetical protein
MDALKLKIRAKDQLHPLLQELMTGYAKFKASAEWEGRARIVGWCVLSVATEPVASSLLIYTREGLSRLTP